MKLVPLNQGSPAWKAWRNDRVGASDFVGILGLKPPWKPPIPTRESVMQSKVEGYEPPLNYAMRRGIRNENPARDAYQRALSCIAKPACVEMDGCPWAAASLDGLCSNHAAIPSERIDWIAEFKSPHWASHDLALAGLVPEHYRPQCQWQLLVTGLARLDYASYTESARFAAGDRLAVVRVEPDPAAQALLLEEAGRFWVEVLERRAAKAAAVTAGVA